MSSGQCLVLAEADMDVSMAIKVLGVTQTQMETAKPTSLVMFKVRPVTGDVTGDVPRYALLYRRYAWTVAWY